MKVLPVGTRLQCGSVLLEVTQIGKDCHSHCTIYYQMGKCIMPSNGIFARVLQEGEISVRDTIQVLPETGKEPFRAAVKCVTDITEIPAKNGKLYVSAIFDCYDLDVLGLSMSDNMKTELCTSTIENMVKSNPSVCGMILHSDRGSQYTSASYRAELSRHGIIQSMNSDGAMIMHAVRLCGQE